MKTIIINGSSKSIPEEIDTVGKLQEFLNIPKAGTAIAVNQKIIKAKERNCFEIKSGDIVTVISAAFGG